MLKLKSKIDYFFGKKINVVKLQILRKMGSNLVPQKPTEVQFQPEIGKEEKGREEEERTEELLTFDFQFQNEAQIPLQQLAPELPSNLFISVAGGNPLLPHSILPYSL